MEVQPQLTQTTVAAIPAAHLFVASNAEGLTIAAIRVADSPAARQACSTATATSSGDPVLAIQLEPRPTAFNWSLSFAADQMASDVTLDFVLTFDPDPTKLTFVPQLTSLKTGDLVVGGDATWLVFLGPNPAIGLGVVDLATGAIAFSPGDNPMVAATWELVQTGV
jgi:hypothetical protein